MVRAIKGRATVEAGGRVAIQSSELREGESAEVIVMVDRPASPADRLAALQSLRKKLKLDPQHAARWEADARAERSAWSSLEGS